MKLYRNILAGQLQVAALCLVAGRILVTGTVLLGYEWLYQYRLMDLAWDSLYTWLAALVLVDFCYYWVHRANHGNHGPEATLQAW